MNEHFCYGFYDDRFDVPTVQRNPFYSAPSFGRRATSRMSTYQASPHARQQKRRNAKQARRNSQHARRLRK